YWLRVSIAPDRFWVQFVPCVGACVGFAAYRRSRGSRWDWAEQLPLVVWVSVLVTPYGGWVFDLTVLLVPVIAAAASVANRATRSPALADASGWYRALAAVLAAGHLAITA